MALTANQACGGTVSAARFSDTLDEDMAAGSDRLPSCKAKLAFSIAKERL
jgi:hypothetical protein